MCLIKNKNFNNFMTRTTALLEIFFVILNAIKRLTILFKTNTHTHKKQQKKNHFLLYKNTQEKWELVAEKKWWKIITLLAPKTKCVRLAVYVANGLPCFTSRATRHQRSIASKKHYNVYTSYRKAPSVTYCVT